jgi:hypothetical protein
VAHALDDRLFPPPEAAKAPGVSPRSVTRLAEQGHPAKLQLLGVARYRRSEINAPIQHGTRPPLAVGDGLMLHRVI